MEVHGDKGTAILENDIITFWSVEGVENPSQTKDTVIHDGATSAAVTDTAGHEALLADFVEAVREDRDPAVTGESARMATELILDIYSSRM
jgi:predicted dehydrogenase